MILLFLLQNYMELCCSLHTHFQSTWYDEHEKCKEEAFMLLVKALVCNYQKDSVGICEKLRFGWQLVSDRREVLQKTYQVQVSCDPLFSQVIYDTQKVDSETSVAVELEGFVPMDATRYFVRVKVSDNAGQQSAYSEPLVVETAFEQGTKVWQASFISPDTQPGDADTSDARLLRKVFALDENVIWARAYTSSLGLYEFFINGKRVGEDLFTPGWTAYQKRVLYQSYDIKDLLEVGDNCLASMVGNGWYKGVIGFECNKNNYGSQTAFFCQVELITESGKHQLLTTDSTWKWQYGPITFSELYDGETYDARKEQSGWDCPDFHEENWKDVEVLAQPTSVLRSQDGLPVRIIQNVEAREIIKTPKGETVIDFGQNLTGWVEFFVRGASGDEVVIRHAEVLDAQGNFYTENLRSAKQTVKYVLKGDGQGEVYHPHFSFQGFRYICIDAYPGKVEIKHFSARVIHSKMENTGTFFCSNSQLNQLQHNILWGLKGNFLDVPTDCPQRDERLGWTGDAQIFVGTACYLMQAFPFFTKWLRDLEADQRADGAVSNVVPNVIKDQGEIDGVIGSSFGSSAWGDAATIVPWTLYRYYGDVQILREQYISMQRWVEFIRSQATDGVIWEKNFSFGDWVALDAKEGSYFGATPTPLISTAFFALSTQILCKSARLLGKFEDERQYSDLYVNIRRAFQERFMKEEGIPVSRTQTSCIVPLVFDLLEAEQKKSTVELLCELLKEQDGHLNTGFVGTPYICKALSEQGKLEEAYALLLKQDYPSWLYQITQGATTIWEHWDGLKPDGSMWSPDMNSFNHYAYGAIGEWLYNVVAGLNIDESKPAFKHSIIRPRIGGDLHFVQASHLSPYGEVSTKWSVENQQVHLVVSIPANTTATVILDGVKIVQCEPAAKENHLEGNVARFELGSGTYTFFYELPMLKNT